MKDFVIVLKADLANALIEKGVKLLVDQSEQVPARWVFMGDSAALQVLTSDAVLNVDYFLSNHMSF